LKQFYDKVSLIPEEQNTYTPSTGEEYNSINVEVSRVVEFNKKCCHEHILH